MFLLLFILFLQIKFACGFGKNLRKLHFKRLNFATISQ